MSGPPFNKLTRRDFLGVTLGSLLLAACKGQTSPATFPGEIISSGSKLGHMLRDGKFPAPTRTEDHPIVIIGSGIAGLSAARWLSKNGVNDYVLLELEAETGGNAVAGKNALTEYPWAAHYLPIPNAESKELIGFLEESKILTGYNEKGIPLFDEKMLCVEPQERLFLHGTWQNDIVPSYGLTREERKQLDDFFATMTAYRNATGTDGKPAFALPIDDSSKDEEWLALDRISMEEFAMKRGWNSPHLRWYINYCCSDDYGTSPRNCSAWAGIHYFAARRGVGANAENGAVLTWPEGNTFLARKLAGFSSAKTRTRTVVFRATQNGNDLLLDCYDDTKQEAYTIRTSRVICAVPQFVRRRIFPETPKAVEAVSYAPWMVANLTVSNWPVETGAELSWDNVIYESSSLGYVDAMHQVLRTYGDKTVLTFYYPLTEMEPAQARQFLRSQDHGQFCALILSELKKAHPQVASCIEHIDVRTWGHAMVRPTTGYIWSNERKTLQQPVNGNLFFCHSDLGGISVFEEAFYQGIRAARELIDTLR